MPLPDAAVLPPLGSDTWASAGRFAHTMVGAATSSAAWSVASSLPSAQGGSVSSNSHVYGCAAPPPAAPTAPNEPAASAPFAAALFKAFPGAAVNGVALEKLYLIACRKI
jgi:hypothetical protein